MEVNINGNTLFYIDENEGTIEYTEIVLNEEFGYSSYIVDTDTINYEGPADERRTFLSLFEFVYVGE